ncbi:UDP-glucose/GDP-mannose dehydrogenase family protein [Nakamurella flava]|uniref:UDP-glucose 6-dehydrogenase n=1 Tax=Nakamurella flava TaxID=2576308 RepID=A0A4U6QCC3_9ACTN|nr:UDP-glucose/GDP-mannose dehydrogenase family protein [Nakamurella flava]TKV57670.1 UDP-glucose/GDP-mannose dehydrogenase family protein [Nakamurella flava]
MSDTDSTTIDAPDHRSPGARPVLSVVGTGYLGATHAAAMAELGFTVIGVDVDAAKIAALQNGKVPFFEPGLPELLSTHVESGRLRFTDDFAEAIGAADVHFLCVGTPQRRGSNAADMTYVDAALDAIARNLTKDAIVVGKSTVPVGTARRLQERLAVTADPAFQVELLWNPEFLREGRAVQDTLRPDRVVIGGASPAADAVMRQVYGTPVAEGAQYITCDLPTAELVKTSANAFLATKISFINAVSELCDAAGADVKRLADAIGVDARIGRGFLNAGLGFGGGCLPKDIRALMHRSTELGADSIVRLLHDVDEINMLQRQRVIDLAVSACDGSVLGRRIAVLGAAFKPDTDDVRDSPALNVAAALHLRGAQVQVFDPEAMDAARHYFPALHYVSSTTEAVENADVVLVLTEWPEFRDADPVALGELVAHRRLVDGRNCLSDPAAWRAVGWTITGLGLGRPAGDLLTVSGGSPR